eukprot:403360382
MFSLRDELRIYLHEMIYIFEQTISGFGRVFQKRMPSKEILRIVSKKAYVSADMDNNGYLTIDEIELWCFNNMEFKKFLMKFVFEDFPIVDFRCFIKESLNTQSELEYIMRLTKSYSLKQRKKVDTSTNLSKTFTSSPSPSRSIIQTPAERQILQLKSKEGGINKVTHSKNSSHANLQAQMLQQNDNNKIDLFPQNQKRKQDSMGGNFTNFGSQTQRASSIKDIMKNNQSLIPEKLLLKMNSKLQLIVKKRYLKNLDQQFDQEIQRRKNFRLMLKQNQRFLMDNEEQENELQQKRKTMKKSQVSYKLISYAKKLASEKKEQDSPKKIKINHGVVQVIHYEDKLRKQSLQNSRLLKNQSQKVQFDEVEDSPKFMSLEKIQSAQPLLKNLKNFRPMTARQRIEVDFDEMIINQNQVLNDQLSQKNSSPQSSLKKEVLNDMELYRVVLLIIVLILQQDFLIFTIVLQYQESKNLPLNIQSVQSKNSNQKMISLIKKCF